MLNTKFAPLYALLLALIVVGHAAVSDADQPVDICARGCQATVVKG